MLYIVLIVLIILVLFISNKEKMSFDDLNPYYSNYVQDLEPTTSRFLDEISMDKKPQYENI